MYQLRHGFCCVLIGILGIWSTEAISASDPMPARSAALQALYDCKKVIGAGPQLACYAAATDALEKSEKGGQLAVVDRRVMSTKEHENFGLTELTSKAFFAVKKTNEPITKLIYRIDHTNRNGSDMIFTTTDGPVWRETEGRDLPDDPTKGSEFIVRRGSFGSYYCQAHNMFAVRCERIR